LAIVLAPYHHHVDVVLIRSDGRREKICGAKTEKRAREIAVAICVQQMHQMEWYQHKLHLHKLLPAVFDGPVIACDSEEWLNNDPGTSEYMETNNELG
jgi:hypothetical protein